MRKIPHKTLRYSIIGILILINLIPLFESQLGFWSLPLSISVFIAFCGFVIISFYLLIVVISNKFSSKENNITFVTITTVLIVIIYFPFGLLHKAFEKEPLFIAEREGGGNCKTFIKLYSDKKLIKRDICFGVTEKGGKFEWIDKDSIKFIYDDAESTFAKIKFDKNGISEYLLYYKSKNDTIPLFMDISLDKLKLKQ